MTVGRWTRWWSGFCFMVLCACGDGRGVTGEFQIIDTIRFEEAFVLVSEVQLVPDDDDPIGYASDIVVTEDGILVADRIQSNIKVFDRGGILTTTIGRPGDGPGELRTPVVLAEHPGGGFVVGEISAKLQSYAPGDRQLKSWGHLD